MEKLQQTVTKLNRLMSEACKADNDPRMTFIGRMALAGNLNVATIASLTHDRDGHWDEDGKFVCTNLDIAKHYTARFRGIFSTATNYGYTINGLDNFFTYLEAAEERVHRVVQLARQLDSISDGRTSSIVDSLFMHPKKVAASILTVLVHIKRIKENFPTSRLQLPGQWTNFYIMSHAAPESVLEILWEIWDMYGYSHDMDTLNEVRDSYAHGLNKLMDYGALDDATYRQSDENAPGFVGAGPLVQTIRDILCINGARGKADKLHDDAKQGFIAFHSSGAHVLYFRNDADFKRGRMTLLAMGKWLRMMLPDATDVVIQEATNSLRVGDVEMVTSYPDWYDAYLNSKVGSCMAYEQSSYEVFEDDRGIKAPDYPHLDLHPVWCYAENSELALAVIKRGDDVVARAIVNTNTNTFRSVYGDYALQSALEAKGFTKNEGFMEGVRLRTMVIGGKHILHPYVDGSASQGDFVQEGDDWFIDCSYHGDYDLQCTDGGRRWFLSGRESIGECAQCGEEMYDDDCTHEVIGESEEYVVVCCHCNSVHTTSSVTLSNGRRETVLDDYVTDSGLSGRQYHEDAVQYYDDCDCTATEEEHDDWLAERKEEEEDDE